MGVSHFSTFLIGEFDNVVFIGVKFKHWHNRVKTLLPRSLKVRWLLVLGAFGTGQYVVTTNAAAAVGWRWYDLVLGGGMCTLARFVGVGLVLMIESKDKVINGEKEGSGLVSKNLKWFQDTPLKSVISKYVRDVNLMWFLAACGYRPLNAGLPSFLTICLMSGQVIMAFYMYWILFYFIHRVCHEVPSLKSYHLQHHEDEHDNVSALTDESRHYDEAYLLHGMRLMVIYASLLPLMPSNIMVIVVYILLIEWTSKMAHSPTTLYADPVHWLPGFGSYQMRHRLHHISVHGRKVNYSMIVWLDDILSTSTPPRPYML